MTYSLGIDLGTTYTGAAIVRDGRVDVVSLGNRAAVIPSVVFLRYDEEVLTGEAANRRGATEPGRVAREFKRRLGDPTPIMVGGTPYSADALMAKLLRWVVDQVSEQQGGPPSAITVSHPANWGPYKIDLLDQAIARAGLDDVGTITEPEAAAIHYASQERVEVGAVVAVFDLGGGTFDAAVLRKIDDGFEILGQPQGIERLGGVDFDEAVFQHVLSMVGDSIGALDPDDPGPLAAVARLRQECVEAKEALSADTDASIPVLLPNLQTEVRITRAEFEGLIRPTLGDAIAALERALRSASVEPEQVSTVLLVGGSSRIPLVAQMVGSSLGRPVAVDAHPKHGVALGAALHAAEHPGERPSGAIAAGAGSVLPAASSEAAAPPERDVPTIAPTPEPEPAAASDGTVVDAPASAAEGSATTPSAARTDASPTHASPTPAPPTTGAAPEVSSSTKRKGPLIALAAIVAVALMAVAALALGGGDDDGDQTGAGPVTVEDTVTPVTDSSTNPSAPGTSAPASTVAPTTVAPATTTEPTPTGPFVRMTGVTLDGGAYVAQYEVFNYTPLIGGDADSLHVHLFLNDIEPVNAGTNSPTPGDWDLTDEPSSFRTSMTAADASARSATQMCAVVATVTHGVFDPSSGTCVDLPAS